ncbi:DUF3078 domain-containing protein [Rhizosphaericola mali]|uniref:DUF3078 domain-containing protein n=1 Tax=Rhizosphaericola mali TaxID=2545455 RepID=A0A5P2GGA6_9BACT|nr:DUF3078 domain-containing protein [Rhizosphaericola mali]QES90751.1 DUF3078 domain-containing protein [Rhizosphaericola mali]
MHRHLKGLFLFIALNWMLTSLTLAQSNVPVRDLPSQIFINISKDDKDTVKWVWKRGGTSNLNLSQTSLSNWAAGGEKFSMSINSVSSFYLYHRKNKHTWDNTLNYSFGYIQTASLGGQKNNDLFDLVSKYGAQMDSAKKWYATILLNPITQLFDGRTYYTKDSSKLISSFFSPAYVTLAVGADWKPIKKALDIFMSPVTSRTTFISNSKLAAQGLYSVDSGRHAYYQFGAFSMITYSDTIMKNVTYTGKLNLFADYLSKPQNVNIYFTNYLVFKVNKYITANYTLNLIYDDKIKQFGPNGTSPALQVLSSIGLGFAVPIKTGYSR